MRVRAAWCAAVILTAVATAPASATETARHSAVVPSSAQSVALAIDAYDSARDRYVESLAVYLGHNRRSTSEYAIALKDFGTAQRLLQAARRDIAKTFKDSVHVAQKAYVAALKTAKSPEQKATAMNVWNDAVREAGSSREAATDSLKALPAAPPKVLRGKG